MTRQRSKFWTFLFSLMPGCGQMYMGFMKRGLSLLGLFAAGCFFAALLNMGELTIFVAVVWFYAFFDALNLGWLEPERFALVSDDYVRFDGKLRSEKALSKYGGIALVILGAAILWQNTFMRLLDSSELYHANYLLYSVLHEIGYGMPRVAVSVLLIVCGIRLIRAKKQQTEQGDDPALPGEGRQ
ncbi:MAG: hypothetical protein VB021_01090 [Oscillospiraceae bacterium]|nr:hypothetical protein [Oscillospiraceae bacterium]